MDIPKDVLEAAGVTLEEALDIVTPDHHGPTWDRNPDGTFKLPERTLGWQVIAWCADYLSNPKGDGPWTFTLEQARFTLWWYAVDCEGKFIYRTGVLQRLKGWGKDPLLAAIVLTEFAGPSLVKRDREDRVVWGEDGNPIGVRHPEAWVQIAAVSQAQTRNTMTMISAIMTDKFKSDFMVKPGAEVTRGYYGRIRLECVTKNYRALEGVRSTFAVMNEALALDTVIPTPEGWTTMGELSDGDVIYGADGKPTTVTKAHPVQEGRDCFEVTFDDGSTVVASDGHWWKVRKAKNRKCPIVQMTTKEMFEAGQEFFLPESFDSIEGSPRELPIDPYLLGLWLGDGSSRSAVIAVDEQDAQEILGYCQAIEPYANIRDKNHIAVTAGRYRSCTKSTQAMLREMGLIQNKHIPAIYMRASFEQRLELLRGLMDSDGSVRRGGNARFSNTDANLLEQVRELLVSLGYHVKPAALQVREGDRAHWKPLGQISFKAVESVNPFRLKRKASQVVGERSTTRSRLRKIVSIVPVASVPVRCISVSAEDKLFLAGEGMHATRNTHHWLEGNWGHDMYRTIDGNATKMGGRYIAITNAYMPGENSVAQNMREKYELILEGKSKNNRFLYDTLEAKAKAPLTGPLVPYILEAVRGDAVWLPIEEVLDSIADRQIGPARSRRMWLNQIVSGEDSLYTPGVWKSIEDEGLVLAPGDTIVLGFDGGKTDDSTALVAIRTADRAAFLLCLEEKPRGPAGENWEVDREKVDGIVRETFRIYNVQAMYADVAQWESYITDWADAYGEGLLVKASDRNAIAFDMRSKKKESTEAHQRLISSILDGKLKHDGDPRLRRHVLNVYRRPNAWGVYFDKESRESPRKVDAYAALMLAHEAMENLRLRGTKKPVRTGRSWFI